MISAEIAQREIYAELGELAAEFTAEARRHLGPIRRELDRGAAEIRLVRTMYWDGSLSPLAALDWLNAGRSMIRSIHAWGPDW
jgi:hypothetical protein